MKNKIIIAGTLFLILGMTGAAQQAQQSQFNPGQVFDNEDTRLNAVYAVDQQNEFYGILFSDGEANFFGTVDSFNAIRGDNVRICQHYLAQRGNILGDIFGNERTVSEVNCVPLQGSVSAEEGQIPVQPQNQTNQTQQNQNPQQQSRNQSGGRILPPRQQGPMQQDQLNQTPQQNQRNRGMLPPRQQGPMQQDQHGQMQQNRTQNQQSQQMGFPDLFYAYDADGNYVTYVINNQGQISNVIGSVQDISQLSQDSVIGCEYFFQAQAITRAQDPSKTNCYGYEELQNRNSQGQIPYLDLGRQSDNETQQNQTLSEEGILNQTPNLMR